MYQGLVGGVAGGWLQGGLGQTPSNDVQGQRSFLGLSWVVLCKCWLLCAVLQPKGVRGHEQVGEARCKVAAGRDSTWLSNSY